MDEKKKVIEDVDKDRRYAIDASIVRIMKSRKQLPHQQLVLECVEQLGRMFKVSLQCLIISVIDDFGYLFVDLANSVMLQFISTF